MENKVMLYNSDGVKIGETFVRRANQLVKQQRAAWVDDEQKAIKFAPGMENMDVNDEASRKSEEYIIALAEKRIKTRKMFKIHSIAFLPVLMFIYLFFVGLASSRMLSWQFANFSMGFVLGIWATLYVVHAYFYGKSRPQKGKSEWQAKELALEIAAIKSEMASRAD